MRGRPPKPTAQRRREGNNGKRKLPPEVELTPGSALATLDQGLECPRGMPAEGRELWEEVVPTLVSSGIAHQVDRAGLVILCTQWAHAERAKMVVDAEGFFTQGSMGQLVEHPALSTIRQAQQLFLRFAEQYGLTPAARARISANHYVAKAAAGTLKKLIDADAEDVVLGE